MRWRSLTLDGRGNRRVDGWIAVLDTRTKGCYVFVGFASSFPRQLTFPALFDNYWFNTTYRKTGKAGGV